MRLRFCSSLTCCLLAATLLSGCSWVFSSSTSTGNDCDWMSAPAAPSANRFVLLLDRSASTWLPAGAGGTIPDYSVTLRAALTAAIGRGDVISIGTFDGTAATARWFADKLRTDRGNPNPDNQRDDQRTAQTCLEQRLSQAQNAAPQSTGSDPYSALAVASQNVASATGKRNIEIATDGLATTGCTDLTHAGIGNDNVIGEIVQRCRQAYHGTIDLRGSTVTMFGIGHPAAGQPQPSTLQLTWLNGLWRGLCGQVGAGCMVSSDAMAQLPGRPGTAGTAVRDPVVAFPPWDHGAVDSHGTLAFRLTGNQLFDRNDAHIGPEGVAALARVAARIVQFGRASVVVNGYTQAEASPEANRQLAQQRADAVAKVLRDHGVTAVRAIGHPGTAPNCPSPYAGGRPDEAALQCTRRVDILATPASR